MVDFNELEVREAFRDFVWDKLRQNDKTINWLVLNSGLSKDTVSERILAEDQVTMPAPNERTRTRILDAFGSSISDFETYIENRLAILAGKQPVIPYASASVATGSVENNVQGKVQGNVTSSTADIETQGEMQDQPLPLPELTTQYDYSSDETLETDSPASEPLQDHSQSGSIEESSSDISSQDTFTTDTEESTVLHGAPVQNNVPEHGKEGLEIEEVSIPDLELPDSTSNEPTITAESENSEQVFIPELEALEKFSADSHDETHGKNENNPEIDLSELEAMEALLNARNTESIVSSDSFNDDESLSSLEKVNPAIEEVEVEQQSDVANSFDYEFPAHQPSYDQPELKEKLQEFSSDEIPTNDVVTPDSIPEQDSISASYQPEAQSISQSVSQPDLEPEHPVIDDKVTDEIPHEPELTLEPKLEEKNSGFIHSGRNTAPSIPSSPAPPKVSIQPTPLESNLDYAIIAKGVLGVFIILGVVITLIMSQDPDDLVMVTQDGALTSETTLTYKAYVELLNQQQQELQEQYESSGDVERMIVAQDLRVMKQKLKDTEQAFDVLKNKVNILVANRPDLTGEQYNDAINSLLDGRDGRANKLIAQLQENERTGNEAEAEVDLQPDEDQGQKELPPAAIVANSGDSIPVEENSVASETESGVAVSSAESEAITETESTADSQIVASTVEDAETVNESNDNMITVISNGKDIEDTTAENNKDSSSNSSSTEQVALLENDESTITATAITDTAITDTTNTDTTTTTDTSQAINVSQENNQRVTKLSEPTFGNNRSSVNAAFLKLSWAFNGDVNASVDEIKGRLIDNVTKYVEHNKIFPTPKFNENWQKVVGDVSEDALYDAVSRFLLTDIIKDTGRSGLVWTTELDLNLKFENFVNDYIEMAIASQKIGYFSNARHFYRIALALAPDHVLNSQNLVENNLAVLLAYNGELKESFQLFDALYRARKLEFGEEATVLADTITNLGNYFMLSGEYNKAYEFYGKAYNIDQQNNVGKHPNFVRDLNNLGNASYKMGNLTEAKSYLEDAQTRAAMYSDLDPLHKTAVFINLGIVSTELGQDKITKADLDNTKNSMVSAFGQGHIFSMYLQAFSKRFNYK